MQHLVAGVFLEHGHGLQRGQGDLFGARIGEVDVVELDGGVAPRDIDRLGVLLNHGNDVEHLEEPLEGHQARHDVDVDVGELGQRGVEPGQVLGQGDHGAHLEGAVDRRHATHPVDDGGGQRRSEGEADQEEAGVGGLRDADVTHPSRLVLEGLGLGLRAAEQLDQHGAADVEALLHDHVHLAVEVVALPGQRPDALSDEPGRDEEDGDEHEGDQGDLPAEEEHGAEHDDDGDEVAHDVGQQIREGLLSPQYVVVEPADQGAGLGPGEEGQGHPLDVAEDLGSHVVNEALADVGRDAPLGEGQTGIAQGQDGDQDGQLNDELGVLLGDAVVDERPQDERVDRPDGGVEDDHGHEDGQDGSVGDGEGEHPPGRALRDPVLEHGTVLAQGAHAAPSAAAPPPIPCPACSSLAT